MKILVLPTKRSRFKGRGCAFWNANSYSCRFVYVCILKPLMTSPGNESEKPLIDASNCDRVLSKKILLHVSYYVTSTDAYRNPNPTGGSHCFQVTDSMQLKG